ncbi:ribonuclease E activity regulator RraA [Deinococcus aerophilus]|uniref:4-hydroxy-4-methyl-2-oxoglutarate aldolase n=1 Tax=Deinococcus aerophilus TaxID=522488 RepID=A0ABQ2GMU6_9DEIO|nr:ribonuclease E activity regulator RraA [Deinococcus aerophilus]GGM02970.1 putative 4-hydroxy-4-methyl-2-oxoglutarate aldolase [Deinococcus aerophilus]
MSALHFTPTSDLSDAHPQAQVFAPVFRDFGGRARFSGPAVTLRVFENNALVRSTLETPGEGRVLVVDGGGSLSCALVGDQLAGLGVQNGWAGIIVYGCVRDTAQIATMPIGIRALAAHPRRSGKAQDGERDVPLTFAGVTVRPGDTVHADEDGVLLL